MVHNTKFLNRNCVLQVNHTCPIVKQYLSVLGIVHDLFLDLIHLNCGAF